MLNKKNSNLIIFSILILCIVSFLFLVINSVGDADKFSSVKNLVPDGFKRYLKKNISYFKAKNYEKDLVKLESQLIHINKKRVSNWRII